MSADTIVSVNVQSPHLFSLPSKTFRINIIFFSQKILSIVICTPMCGVFPFRFILQPSSKLAEKRCRNDSFKLVHLANFIQRKEERKFQHGQKTSSSTSCCSNRMRVFSQMKRLTFNLVKDEGASNSAVSLQTEIFKMVGVLGE